MINTKPKKRTQAAGRPVSLHLPSLSGLGVWRSLGRNFSSSGIVHPPARHLGDGFP
jgi:hypothetical protein